MKLITKLLMASFLLTGVFSCTKLDEKFRDAVTTFATEIDPADLLQGAYNSLGTPFADQSRFYAAQEHTSDEMLGPTRGPDWDDNGVWRVLHSHQWNADHGFLRDGYRELLQAQFAASEVIQSASASAQQKAEATFVRSLAMFATLDAYDQVPFRADINDLKTLPETKSGVGCADFLIGELEAALPSLRDWSAGTANIKANKNAARALLIKLYLNRGVYAVRAKPGDAPSATAPTFAAADMDKVIALADAITASGQVLEPFYFDNFGYNNLNSKELIYGLESSPGVRGFGVQHRYYMTLHYNQKPSGWNGFATLSDFYNKFGAGDYRRDSTYPGMTDISGMHVGFLRGQQKDASGKELDDRKGNKLAFTDAVALKETGNNLEITGIRVIKYPPDYVKEFPTRAQYVIFRYGDVLLEKAEALFRKGDVAGATTIVNQVRARAKAPAITGTLTAQNLIDERGREMYWEGWRRNDLIRFGKFLDAWQEKAQSGPERLLFCIPNEQIAVNPNLVQNGGY
jgi:hypothetical protein